MSLSIGIVGLPNVGIVPVPDERLLKLAGVVRDSEAGIRGKEVPLPPLKPATMMFVDFAGLVKGASEGSPPPR